MAKGVAKEAPKAMAAHRMGPEEKCRRTETTMMVTGIVATKLNCPRTSSGIVQAEMVTLRGTLSCRVVAEMCVVVMVFPVV